jgi:hypothetical protein
MELTLVAAYGRKYNTLDQVKKDWEAGRDFQIATAAHPNYGAYTSIRDLHSFPGVHCKIRYNNNEDFALVDIKTGEFK